METRYLYLLRFALAFSDLVVINLCFFLGYYFLNNGLAVVDTSFFKQTAVVCSLLWLVSAGFFELYSKTVVRKLSLIYKASWQSLMVHCGLFLLYFIFMDHASLPKHFLALFYIVVSLGLLVSRYLGTALQKTLRTSFDIRKVVAVLSIKNGGLKLADYLKSQNSLNFVGFLEKLHGMNSLLPKPLSTRDQLKQAASAGVEEVFVSVDPHDMATVNELIKQSEEECVRLKFVPNIETAHTALNFNLGDNFTVLNARTEPLEDMTNRLVKRLFDLVVSVTAIVFIFSWLYPILALIIKIQSPGPVLFKQIRTGRDNKPFACYKFRSMYLNKQSDNQQATVGDTRITPIGRLMRRTSLDEFPQFFNVLLGSMSVIGPRPHMLRHTEEYRQIVDRYMVRQFLKPGISGWAQVRGFRGEIREKGLMRKRVEHDLWYMENWTVMLDIRIMYLTILNIFKKEENAY